MGKCFSSDIPEHPPESVFNDFFYLCRDLKYLIRISNSTISKLKYENSIKIRKDSGIGHLNDGRIMVGGGTDSSGCLTNSVYILDTINSKVTILPNMPILCKEGRFFHYREFVYLVGAVVESDEEIMVQEQSAPIMKFYLLTGEWEIFNEEADKGMNFKDFINNTHGEAEETEIEDEIRYADVIYPGMFMVGSRVYLINGQRISTKGALKMMSLVFSLDLDQDGFDFRVESFKSPLNVFRPVCGSYYKTAFVTGGVDLSRKQFSLKSFLIDFDLPEPKIIEIPGLQLDEIGTYPILGSSSSFIALSFPNLAIYNREKKVWSQFILDHQKVLRLPTSKTSLMQTDKIHSKNIFESKTRIRVQKGLYTSEDFISNIEDSEFDEMKVKLPPGLILDEDVSKTIQQEINSSRSSNTFSMERKIPMPEALLGINSPQSFAFSQSKVINFESPVSSIHKHDSSLFLRNRPMVDQFPAANKQRIMPEAYESVPNGILISKETVIINTESEESEIKNPISSLKKNDSVSSSESFEVESSNSSFSDEQKIEVSNQPMSKKLAPIIERVKAKQNNSKLYSFSEPESSDSFNYEEDSGKEKSLSISSSKYKKPT